MAPEKIKQHTPRIYRSIACPVCGNQTIDETWLCERCGWIYEGGPFEDERYDREYDAFEESEPSVLNGTTIREYRVRLLNSLMRKRHDGDPEAEPPPFYRCSDLNGVSDQSGELNDLQPEKLTKEGDERSGGHFRRSIVCPVCGNRTFLEPREVERCRWCGWTYNDYWSNGKWSYGGILNEDEPSGLYGDTIRQYRLEKLNDLLQEKWEDDHAEDWIHMPGLHPKMIPVKKRVLFSWLCGLWAEEPFKDLVRVLAFGETDPRFDEWLAKICFEMQGISALVYPMEVRSADGAPRIEKAKLPQKEYAHCIFDSGIAGICGEYPADFRELLEEVFEEKGLSWEDVSDDLAYRTFKKFRAVVRYTLPMITDTGTVADFSFFQHIILCVVRNDDHT